MSRSVTGVNGPERTGRCRKLRYRSAAANDRWLQTRIAAPNLRRLRIDALVSRHRNTEAARRFFQRVLTTLKVWPTEVVTDAAAIYPAVLDELMPSAWHHVQQYANNPLECDHSRLKSMLRPMRGLQTDRTTQVIIAGHAFMQNLRRWHYEIAVDAPPAMRIAAAFTELAQAI